MLELSLVHHAGYGPADDPACDASFSFRANLGQCWRQALGRLSSLSQPMPGHLVNQMALEGKSSRKGELRATAIFTSLSSPVHTSAYARSQPSSSLEKVWEVLVCGAVRFYLGNVLITAFSANAMINPVVLVLTFFTQDTGLHRSWTHTPSVKEWSDPVHLGNSLFSE